MSPKFLSLFSGAGGLDIGLEAAGFEHLAAIEIDPIARATVLSNRPHWHFLDEGDVVSQAGRLLPADLGLGTGDLELLAGAPPCQPFSAASLWKKGERGMKDGRADTVVAMMELVRAFLPRVVLFENVAGFVAGAGAALPFIQRSFRAINREVGSSYLPYHLVVDSADFGVAQRRRRAIIVALRDGDDWTWPTETHRAEPVAVGEALADAGGVDDYPLPVPTGKWADLLASLPAGENYQWFSTRGQGPELFGDRTRYSNFLLKLHPELPSWTLTASPGPSTGPFHWENRPLSSREMMRIQSFPDSWQVLGTYRERTRLIGNATPPLLGEVLGRELMHRSFGAAPKGGPTLATRRSRSGVRLPPLVPVPEKYLNHVGSHPAHPGTGLGPAPRRKRRRPA